MRPDHRIMRAAMRLDRMATIKPLVDSHLAERLAHCDTRQTNETGISGGGLNDPVISAVMARAGVMDQSNRIEDALSRVEAAVNDLGAALNRVKVPRSRAAEAEVECAGGDPSTWGDTSCGELVGYYKRGDGSTGLRSDGLCDKHRVRKSRWERENAA